MKFDWTRFLAGYREIEGRLWIGKKLDSATRVAFNLLEEKRFLSRIENPKRGWYSTDTEHRSEEINSEMKLDLQSSASKRDSLCSADQRNRKEKKKRKERIRLIRPLVESFVLFVSSYYHGSWLILSSGWIDSFANIWKKYYSNSLNEESSFSRRAMLANNYSERILERFTIIT